MVPGVTIETVKIHMIPPRPRLDRRAWFANDIPRNAAFFFWRIHVPKKVGKKQGHFFMKIMENALTQPSFNV